MWLLSFLFDLAPEPSCGDNLTWLAIFQDISESYCTQSTIDWSWSEIEFFFSAQTQKIIATEKAGGQYDPSRKMAALKKCVSRPALPSLESHHQTSSPATHVRYRSTNTPPNEELNDRMNLWSVEYGDICAWRTKMRLDHPNHDYCIIVV